MKASDLFIHCLEDQGVHHIFGVPGEESLDLLDLLASSRYAGRRTDEQPTAPPS